MEPQLIQQAIFLKETGVFLVSTHRHDCVFATTPLGEWMLDAGKGYQRRSFPCDKQGNIFPEVMDAYEEYSLNTEYPVDYIRSRLLWGSRGKDGKQPLTYRPIKDLELGHLKAILRDYADKLDEWRKDAVTYWLEVKTKEKA